VYPRVAGIPWLFPDPNDALAGWRNRYARYMEELRASGRAVAEEAAHSELAQTRDRLQRLATGYAEQERLVTALLAPLSVADTPLAAIAHEAFGTALPLRQDLHSYYTNVHRDWVWGEEENEASHALVATALGEERTRVLVLGAGACRLAYDLHERSTTPLSVALDINPLLLLAAQRVLSGDSIGLVEFPLAPRTLADVAVRRELRAPARARPGLELVFGDAWRAPFAAQSFDAVITPWLIDVVDLDFAAVAAHVNRLLVPDGRWVNFGSLAFPWRRAALRLSPAELEPALSKTGFTVAAMRDASVPYMRSPASRHSRIEEVLVFSADKRERAPRVPPPLLPPAWLASDSLAIPPSTAFFVSANASRIQAVILGLVDGRRSVDDITRILAEQGLLPADQARVAVRGLLERVHNGSERVTYGA
jgi:hypothetical protein